MAALNDATETLNVGQLIDSLKIDSIIWLVKLLQRRQIVKYSLLSWGTQLSESLKWKTHSCGKKANNAYAK